MSVKPISGLHGLILAAGGGGRMGQDKQGLVVDGETLLVKAVRQASSVCGSGVSVVLGSNRDVHVDSVTRPRVAVIDNVDWRKGMSTSIRAGIDNVPSDARAVLIVLPDQVAVTEDCLWRVAFEWNREPAKIVASHYNFTLGPPVVFPREYFDELGKIRGDRGAKSVILSNQNAVLVIDTPEAAVDLDTPEDLSRLV